MTWQIFSTVVENISGLMTAFLLYWAPKVCRPWEGEPENRDCKIQVLIRCICRLKSISCRHIHTYTVNWKFV